MSRINRTPLWLFLAGVALLAAAPRAHALGVDGGVYFSVEKDPSKQCTLGPWYAYFPYEAHFQMPAPVGPFPHWPTPYPPQVQPPANVPAPAAQTQGQFQPPPPANPTPPQGPALQPVGYYYGMQVPSYWYGR